MMPSVVDFPRNEPMNKQTFQQNHFQLNQQQAPSSQQQSTPGQSSKKESSVESVKRQQSNMGRSPHKISTVLTNVQRRNIQTTAPVIFKDMTVHQMSAQGELLLLQEKIDEPGFDINVQDAQGFSALLWACANGQKTAVDMLIFKGANPHLTGDNGENGLLLASCYGHHEIVILLLRHGLDVNCSDELLGTPLMYAAFNNHVACLTILLDWGADITQEDAEGSTALDCAIKRGSKAAQKVLEKRMIDILTGVLGHNAN